MGRAITVDVDNVMIDGIEHDAGDEVVISDSEFAALTAAGRFTDGTLTDGGEVADDEGDEVITQGAAVAAPAALTSAPSVAAPTKAEFDAVVADLVALRATVVALRTSLTGDGKPLASA